MRVLEKVDSVREEKEQIFQLLKVRNEEPAKGREEVSKRMRIF